MLEVLADEAILNWIAQVVQGLHHVITPFSTESQRSAIEDLVVLY